MDYIGTWSFHSIGTFGEEGMVYLDAQSYLDSPMPYVDTSDPEAVADEMNERRRAVETKVKICPDGKLYMLMPIPASASQEEVDQAVAAGIFTLVDGMLADRPMAWELRDGALWIDTGMEGTVFDEKADTWVKAVDEEGLFCFFTSRFQKD